MSVMFKLTTPLMTEYADYFSSWFGLRDGSLLEWHDKRGEFWVKIGKEVMNEEEFKQFNKQQDGECD